MSNNNILQNITRLPHSNQNIHTSISIHSYIQVLLSSNEKLEQMHYAVGSNPGFPKTENVGTLYIFQPRESRFGMVWNWVFAAGKEQSLRVKLWKNVHIPTPFVSHLVV